MNFELTEIIHCKENLYMRDSSNRGNILSNSKIILYYIILYYIILYYIILYCIILYCIVLYCIVLYY